MSNARRHKYDYSIDLQSDHVGVRILRLVGERRRVLEIGAGPGSITRLLQEHGKCLVTAIELDADAIECLSQFCEHVYQCDLNQAGWTEIVVVEGKFQVVVAADVLEHLYDPLMTLRGMKSVLTDDGCIVISLPHIGHQSVLASIAAGNFEYHDWGLLDRTHIRFFGINSMQQLMEDAGLKIVSAEFLVRAPEQTEFARDWAAIDSELRASLEKIPFGQIYQVVIKAVPLSAPGDPLKLSTLAVPVAGPLLPPGASLGSICRIMLKRLAQRFLSQRARSRLSGILTRIGIRL